MLQSMGSQRVGHKLVTEQQLKIYYGLTLPGSGLHIFTYVTFHSPYNNSKSSCCCQYYSCFTGEETEA